MPGSCRRAMTMSALALAKEALATAAAALPAYSHPNSPKKFTQHQLFAILAVKEFLRLRYRHMEQLLADWSDLRNALSIKDIPDYSTLCRAHQRLLKRGLSRNCSPGQWRGPAGEG